MYNSFPYRRSSGSADPPTKKPRTARQADEHDDSESIDHLPLDNENVKLRLYNIPHLTKPAKKELPALEDDILKRLRDQVRIMNGLYPTLVRKGKKVICYMDSPETRPRMNTTFTTRHKHIRHWIEDRKYSEENVYTDRCKSNKT